MGQSLVGGLGVSNPVTKDRGGLWLLGSVKQTKMQMNKLHERRIFWNPTLCLVYGHVVIRYDVFTLVMEHKSQQPVEPQT